MYYGQFGIDKVIHERFFPEKRNGFFVECGAYDGLLESSCKFFEESMGWTGINIEAVPLFYQKLVANRPACQNYNLALSDTTEIKTFNHAIHPEWGYLFGNGSIKHSPEHMQDLLNQGCRFERFSVQCKKFSDLNVKNEIDLFVLDVEGHEIEALKGIVESEKLPTVFCIEFPITGLEKISSLLPMYNFHSVHVNNAFYVKK